MRPPRIALLLAGGLLLIGFSFWLAGQRTLKRDPDYHGPVAAPASPAETG